APATGSGCPLRPPRLGSLLPAGARAARRALPALALLAGFRFLGSALLALASLAGFGFLAFAFFTSLGFAALGFLLGALLRLAPQLARGGGDHAGQALNAAPEHGGRGLLALLSELADLGRGLERLGPPPQQATSASGRRHRGRHQQPAPLAKPSQQVTAGQAECHRSAALHAPPRPVGSHPPLIRQPLIAHTTFTVHIRREVLYLADIVGSCTAGPHRRHHEGCGPPPG